MRVREHCRHIASTAALWGLAAAALTVGIGSCPLSNNNEGLYAAIAASMLRTGHFLVPKLAGLPYIEKPPLLYWLMAGSFALFGPDAFAARLVPAMAALASCVTLFVLFRRLGLRREASVAVVIFATCAGVVTLAHIVLFDMLLTFGLAVALAGGCVWFVGRGESAGALKVVAVGLAIAVMSKGLVAIALFGGTLLALALLEPAGARGWMRRIADPGAAVLLLALVLPWHVAVAWKQRGFLWFYFINNQALRFLGLRSPHDYHEGAWYFYVPRLLLSSMPWLWLAPALVFGGKAPDTTRARAERFMLAAAAVPFLFFSVSRAKADYYTVVCLPPLAAWLALRLGRLTERGWRALGVCAALVAAGMLGGVAYLALAARPLSGRGAALLGILRARGDLAGWLAAGLVLSPLAAAVAVRRGAHLLGVGCFGLQTLVLALGAAAIAAGSAPIFSDAALVRQATARPGSTPLLVYGSPESVSAALFYTHERFRIVDSRSADFWFAEQERYGIGTMFLDSTEVERRARSRRLLLLVPRRELARFERSPLLGAFTLLSRAPTASLWTSRPLGRLAGMPSPQRPRRGAAAREVAR